MSRSTAVQQVGIEFDWFFADRCNPTFGYCCYNYVVCHMSYATRVYCDKTAEATITRFRRKVFQYLYF